ncbi:MAG: riboflavin kinase/FMN adenylyltransferase, partial [Halieaceae bacterium]
NFEIANQFLGYAFMLTGTVIHGNKLGNSIGFPTANIHIESSFKLIPASGVYVVHILVGNRTYGGMLNIGSKPTVNLTTEKSIEVNIFDFEADVYGKTIQVYFQHRIRNEQKFDSLDELKKQLARDKETSIKLLAK